MATWRRWPIETPLGGFMKNARFDTISMALLVTLAGILLAGTFLGPQASEAAAQDEPKKAIALEGIAPQSVGAEGRGGTAVAKPEVPASDEPGKSPTAPSASPEVPGQASSPPAAPGITPGSPPSGAPPGAEPGKKPEPSKSPPLVTRLKEPPEPPEWNVEENPSGLVRVNFRGQPWPKVLEWIADLSQMSLDWQELPGDYLNLSTQQAYTVEELRNLINWHLFQRGFTMLRQGEVLTVVNLDKLDPGIVPHVTPEELSRVPSFDFVRVTFPLGWLVAEQAAEELKPLLSPRGKLFPLSVTNRLQAMDLATNLREIARVLQQEQSGGGQERLVREFVLRYARAEETVRQLKELLGVREVSLPMPPGMNPQQIQQLQQMMAAQGAAPGQPVTVGVPGAVPGKGAPPTFRRPSDVNLVVNTRRNSVVAQAPPDKMAVIEQAIKLLDVPGDQEAALLANMNRFQVYRLTAIDPEPLVKTLQEIGGLDPTTRLEVDKQNNAIIAYAPLADHVTIRTVIERLDGSGRRFEVIQLRRLPADYVAGTIEFMMGTPESTTGEAAAPWLPPWERARRREEAQPRNRFRVDADVENNRLLLWANDIEIQEIQKLLVKLGEISEPGASAGRVRVLEFSDASQAEAALDLLKRHWNRLSPYPLRIEKAPQTPANTAPQSPSESPGPPSEGEPFGPQAQQLPQRQRQEVTSPPERMPKIALREAVLSRYSGTGREGTVPGESPGSGIPRGSGQPESFEPSQNEAHVQGQPPRDTTPQSIDEESATSSAPEMTVYQAPDGRLLLACPDPRALDLVEHLLREALPPPPTYQIFRLRYAWADNVAKILESLFSDQEDSRGRSLPWFFDPWGWSSRSEPSRTARLSQRRAVKFVVERDTNSIVVQNADQRQLAEIKQVIDFYDQPPPMDGQSVRVTEIFPLKWSKASQVATAIKDVYRDLLSPNENQRSGDRGIVVFFPDQFSESRTPRFKGLLSVGVDEVSNSLIVSAPVYLMTEIRELITQLDRQAEPNATTVEVIRLNGVSAEHLRKGLGNILSGSQPPPQGSREPSGAKSPGEPQPPSRERKP